MKNRFSYEMPSHLMGYTGSPRGSGSTYDESGFNDAGVGVSATETIVSNARTVSVDPCVKETGIVEEVIPTIILSQAKSARDRFTRGNVDAAIAVSRELVNTLVTQLSPRTNQLYRFPGS